MRLTANGITEEKSTGRIYTPDYIVNNILDLSGYYGSKILKKHVIDNSCGDGAFICEIVKRYCEEALSLGTSLTDLSCELATYVHGIEIEEKEWKKCILNANDTASLFGVGSVDWDIICADALHTKKYNGKMDFVLGNPPYVRVHNLGESFYDIKQFTFSQGGMTDLFIVFYEIGLKMLNANGVLGYITPSSFFNSLAGSYMRKFLVEKNLIEKIVDLKHYQAFSATTYTTIVILKNNHSSNTIEYFQYDEKNLIPYYVDSLTSSDFYISDSFYFSNCRDLSLLKKILTNFGNSDILVKNGYATLCDKVFIGNFNFKSKYIIPVIKSSKGLKQQIIYPYDKNAKLIPESELQQDEPLYSYLLSQKDKLVNRSNEKDANEYWYAFGRSQALGDTYKDKVAINTLIRNADDFKFVYAPAGTGVYGGLYIISNSIPINEIKEALVSDEFVKYVSLLGKYKSGGYYTFSSKDVKSFLDYKFAYNGGLFS